MNSKKLITGLILLLIFTYVKGQDKIITIQKDTITCHIISVSLTHIIYEQNSGSFYKESLSIPMNQVREYIISSQPQSSQSQTSRPQTSRPQSSQPQSSQPQKTYPVFSRREQFAESFPRWRVGIQGGASYIFSPLTNLIQEAKNSGLSPFNEVDDYYKNLRMGLNASVDAHYFITGSIGVGLKYSIVAFSTKKDFLIKDNYSSIPTYSGVGKNEKIYLNYIGPSVVFRQWLNEDNTFRLNEEISIGYASYRDEVRFDHNQDAPINPYLNKPEYNFIEEGNTFGGSFQLSLEYYPVSWFSLGLNAGVSSTILTILKVTDKETSVARLVNKDDYFNMSHIDCSLGMRFHF